MTNKTQVSGASGSTVKANVPVRTQELKPIEVFKEIRTGSNGEDYIFLSYENVSISLWNAKVPDDPEKGSRILFNATLSIKSDIGTFVQRVPVKQFTKGEQEGRFIIGGKSTSMSNMHATLSDYDKKLDKSYDRVTMSYDLYNTIIAMIEAGTA